MEDLKRKLLGVYGIYGELPDGIMNGYEITSTMLTMIGYKRLTNIETLINDVLLNKIKGDLIETGVWRGGAVIFMRELLNRNNSKKKVYVADSFAGLPKPDEKYIHDKGDKHFEVGLLSVSMKQVKENFLKYTTLKNVVFLKGWFKDTLPKLKNKFSIIRLDGDMYESSIDALNNLYPLLSVGGYCIIDDYGAVVGCQEAVKDYRRDNNISAELIQIDGTAVYWKKEVA